MPRSMAHTVWIKKFGQKIRGILLGLTNICSWARVCSNIDLYVAYLAWWCDILEMMKMFFFQANDFSCSNPNEAYCWMGCYPLPSGCNRTQSVCYNEDHEACNTVDDGPPHDPTCKWHCKDPDPTPSPTSSPATGPTSSPATGPTSSPTTDPTPGPTPDDFQVMEAELRWQICCGLRRGLRPRVLYRSNNCAQTQDCKQVIVRRA